MGLLLTTTTGSSLLWCVASLSRAVFRQSNDRQFSNLKANLYILTSQKLRKFRNLEQDYAKCKYCRNFIKSLPDDKISSLSKFNVFEYIAWLMGGVKTSQTTKACYFGFFTQMIKCLEFQF